MVSDVLVVDDEADIRELVAGILSDEGYAVRTANDSESALAAFRARKPALLVLDIWMAGGGMDGLELLDLVKGLDGDLPVIMISGHGNIETAVSAIKRGAYEFLEKPFKSDRLLLVVERALEAANLRRENRRLRTQAITPEGMTGRSMAAQQLRHMIVKLAGANSRILISGPPGSGKETVARLIHGASNRARNEFVPISAAGLTPAPMDVELFSPEGDNSRTAGPAACRRGRGAGGPPTADRGGGGAGTCRGRGTRACSRVRVPAETPAAPITANTLPAEAMVTDQAPSLGAERMIALPLRE